MPDNALDKWRHVFCDELRRVDRTIIEQTDGEVALIGEIVQYIISSGGKRLRPILTIISAKLCQYEGQRHIELATAIEFFHTATLLHDDVVDESDLRRGVKTANIVWGNAASVLVGDFLLGKAFQILSYDGSVAILKILSDTSALITEGEVRQLVQIGDINISQATYLEIIASKTASLFRAACQVGAMVSHQSAEKQNALRDFGEHLGVAFQIVDDVLDYSAVEEKLGKSVGDDLREGKVTLPVILAYGQSNEREKAFWQRVVHDEQKDVDLAQALVIIAKYDILDQSITLAKEYAQKAVGCLEIFDDCDEKQALIDLLEFAVNRPY